MTDSSTPADPAVLDAPAAGSTAGTKKSKPRSPALASRKAPSGDTPAVEAKSVVKSAKPKKAAKPAVAVSMPKPDTALPTKPQGAEPLVAEPQLVEPQAVAPQAPEPQAVEPRVATPQVELAHEEAEELDDSERLIQEPRFWQDDGWTAKVIKNEDDEGWAVAMTLDGEPEPALVGPWTMGRDKKNPKPLDANAFSVLVKTAYEVRRRHEQALHAMLHKSVTVEYQGDRCKVSLQIVPDEYEPHAFLRAFDALDDLLAEVRVEANYKLTNQSAAQWISNDFRRPGGH